MNFMPYEIEGITLLDQTTIEAVTAMPTWAAIIIGASVIVAFGLFLAALVSWGEKESYVYLVITVLLTILWVSMFFVPEKLVSPEYIKYSVTIDDNVSMNEFLEHYEILDQHGKIYEIREISNAPNINR